MPRLPYLDALRGYAILFVIVGHCVFTIGDLPPSIATSFLAYGGRGVQLFFVVSAITLMFSWEAKNDGHLPFYLRRVFRIAPMWWLALVYWLLWMGFEPRFFAPSGIGFHDVLFSATLSNGISPKALMSIVPGGWSIAAEALFYVAFPLLAALSKNLASSVLVLAAAMLLRIAGNSFLLSLNIQPEVVQAAFLEHSIINQLPIFVLGICTYHAILSIRYPRLVASAVILIAFAVTILLPYASKMVQPTPMAFGVCWAFATWGFANGGAALLINKPIELLGKISYSAYFWHFIFLGNILDNPRLSGGSLAFLVLFLKTMALTVPMSWLTYQIVEKPMMRVGSRVAQKYSHAL